MAAVLAALLLLGLLPAPAHSLRVWVSSPRTVALPFQRVRLRCRFETSAPPEAPPLPLVTWKFLSPCSAPPLSPDESIEAEGEGGEKGGGGGGGGRGWSLGSALGACPEGEERRERIVASKQGGAVSVGRYYRDRGVTIEGGAELVLDPASWGDSGLYVCTVSSIQDVEGNNEAVAELLVLDWLFVVLVALGASLVALGLGLCWCQCCPHTCCCLLRCPCCPQRCCCPEALYLAGKAATSGGVSVAYGPPQHPIALQSLGSSHSSQVPLLRDSDGSVVWAPPAPSPPLLRYLEAQISSLQPHGHCPPLKPAPPPSDVSSLHEPPPKCWTPPTSRPAPPLPSSYPQASRGRWRSAEVLGGGEEEEEEPPPPPSRPRSRSRDDVVGGAEPLPSQRSRGAPPRRLRKDALSRESLVV